MNRSSSPSATPSRTSPLLRRCTAVVFLFALGCVSCSIETGVTSSTDPAAETTTESTDETTDTDNPQGIERSELSEEENAALDNIILAVANQPEVWEGFSLADIPTIVPLLGPDGEMTSAFVFFHPNPQAAGEAVPIDGIDELPDLHYIPQIVDVPAPDKFSFEVDADVGGVPTYVFPADTDIPVWPAVFVHEGFHVFQIRFWADRDFEDQEAYDIDVRNYELALLEDQALIAAYQATGDESTEAIRHFLALRATRLAEFPKVVLDAQQEAIEGSAEWFEWQHTLRSNVDDPWANPSSADLADPFGFAKGWAPDFAGIAPLQRFYHTGATQLALLDRLGIDWQPQLEQNAAPSEILAGIVEVDPSEYEALVDTARQAYDPDGELAAVAELWITAEPGGEFAGEPTEEMSFADAPPEVIACVAEYGLTAEQLDADPALLTPEIDEACVEAYALRLFDCITDAGLDPNSLDYENLPPEAEACIG